MIKELKISSSTQKYLNSDPLERCIESLLTYTSVLVSLYMYHEFDHFNSRAFISYSQCGTVQIRHTLYYLTVVFLSPIIHVIIHVHVCIIY